MQLSGVQKFTVLDYPDRTACIAFTPGCNFRCGYCHNPEFVLPEKIKQIKDSFIAEDVFFRFLDDRKGLLDGVVITGGEPTIMRDLPDFMRKIKDMGFLVKLDTNGNNPIMLESILEQGIVDYVAMDVKTSSPLYKELVGSRAIPEHIEKSIKMIMNSGLDYEFRSTLVRDLHTKEILEDMAGMIEGAKVLYLQKFREGKVLDPSFAGYKSFSDEELEEIEEMFRGKVNKVIIRP